MNPHSSLYFGQFIPTAWFVDERLHNIRVSDEERRWWGACFGNHVFSDPLSYIIYKLCDAIYDFGIIRETGLGLLGLHVNPIGPPEVFDPGILEIKDGDTLFISLECLETKALNECCPLKTVRIFKAGVVILGFTIRSRQNPRFYMRGTLTFLVRRKCSSKRPRL